MQYSFRLIVVVAAALMAATLRGVAPTHAQSAFDPLFGRSDLSAAPVTQGESRFSAFPGVLMVPPASVTQLVSATIVSAGSSDGGNSYDIVLDLPNGRAQLSGSLGSGMYDDTVAVAPAGCRTATGQARGYCFRDGPHYEYFPAHMVANSAAIVVYGGFETNYGASAQVTWYDSYLDTSYALTISGPDAVAQAGFSGANPANHLEPAFDLAALAEQFIGI